MQAPHQASQQHRCSPGATPGWRAPAQPKPAQLLRRGRAAPTTPAVVQHATRREQQALDAQQQLEAQQQLQQQQQQQQQQPSNAFQAAVEKLLTRAATSLTRAQATCLTCRGQGSCSCPMCQGAGLTDEQHSRVNVVREAAQKMRQALHLSRSDYHRDYMVSNRCRRCRGAGLIVCPTCNGMGTRHAGVKPE